MAAPASSVPFAAPPSDKPRRVLVTGGTGFIGSHTCLELLAAGYAIEILDNLDNSSLECLRRVEELAGQRISFHLIDLCNEQALETLFARSEPFDAVIHFAGLKAVGESVAIPLRYYHNNIAGTINLLRVMQRHNCRNLVFSSSATVYGDAKTVPVPETYEPLQCTNAYGRTKLFIEDILRDVVNGEDGDKWRVVLLRYFNPVGAHESGRIGEDPQGIPNNLMPYISQVAVGRRPHLNVFGNDYDTVDGTGVRDYIHVVDLARGHVAAITNGIYGDLPSRCEAFNLGTGNGYSVLQMLAALGKAAGKELPHKIVARREGDVGKSYADASKAARILGWKAELGLERMCADAWRWQSQNPNGFRPEAEAADK